MNPDKREAERQWQRESFESVTEGRELDTIEDVDQIAMFDGDAMDDGQEAWIESDEYVDVRESL